jgi:hypothetical protein
MAMKKGRAVLKSERPVYDALAQRMLDGVIHFFCVPTKGTWEVWTAGPGPADREHSDALGAPDLVMTDAEASAFVGLATTAAAPNRTVFAVKTADLDGLDPELVRQRLTAALTEMRHDAEAAAYVGLRRVS